VRGAALGERQDTFLEGRRLRETLLEEEGLDLRVGHLREGKGEKGVGVPARGAWDVKFLRPPGSRGHHGCPSWLVPYNTWGFTGIVGNIFVSLRIWVRALGTVAFPLTPKLFLGNL
jgi:hypothetical protein